jgi:hypothetical protein
LPVTPQSIGGMDVVDIIINSKNELIALIFQSTGGHADQIFLAAFDLDGNELWIRPYAKKSDYPLMVNQIGLKLIEHNNEYYIAGDCYYPYPNNPDHVFLRPFFIGIDSSFKEKWVKPFHALDSVFGWAEAFIIPLMIRSLWVLVIRRNIVIIHMHCLCSLALEGEELSDTAKLLTKQLGPNNKFKLDYQMERINDTLFISTRLWFGVKCRLQTQYGELVFDTAWEPLYNFKTKDVKNKTNGNGEDCMTTTL